MAKKNKTINAVLIKNIRFKVREGTILPSGSIVENGFKKVIENDFETDFTATAIATLN